MQQHYMSLNDVFIHKNIVLSINSHFIGAFRSDIGFLRKARIFRLLVIPCTG